MKKRLLFITHRVPYPPDKGERLRAYHELAALAGHFRVTVAALAHRPVDGEAVGPLGRLAEKVLLAPAGGLRGLARGAGMVLAGRTVTEGYFQSPALARLLAEEARREPFDLVLASCSSTLGLALGVPAPARVMDLIDADSLKWQAYAASAAWPLSVLYAREARGVAALERRATETCDAVLLISQAEIEAMDVRSEKLMAVGPGVDLDYFSPPPAADEESGGLVFTGTMDYRPNVEGVCWFVREVWPQLRRRISDLTFTIVGRNPTRAVQALGQTAGVTVTGGVPDVRPYVTAARLAVAPLRVARGVQNKILEAMAMGRAVVATSPALEGLELEVGVEAARADSPEEWCERVGELLGDAAHRRRIEQAARRCVEANYTWAAQMAPLVDLCRRLTGEAVSEP